MQGTGDALELAHQCGVDAHRRDTDGVGGLGTHAIIATVSIIHFRACMHQYALACMYQYALAHVRIGLTDLLVRVAKLLQFRLPPCTLHLHCGTLNSVL